MMCDDIKILKEELKRAVECLEREGLYTAAFILLFKLLVSVIDYDFCLKGILIRNHKHRKEQLEYLEYEFKDLKECYEKMYIRYRGAYRKVVTKEEYMHYKSKIEKCLK